MAYVSRFDVTRISRPAWAGFSSVSHERVQELEGLRPSKSDNYYSRPITIICQSTCGCLSHSGCKSKQVPLIEKKTREPDEAQDINEGPSSVFYACLLFLKAWRKKPPEKHRLRWDLREDGERSRTSRLTQTWLILANIWLLLTVF